MPLGCAPHRGDPNGLLAWAGLFAVEGIDQESRESNFRRLVAASREDPVAHIPSELVLLGRVLIVQTGLISSLRPSWTIEELAERHLRADPSM